MKKEIKKAVILAAGLGTRFLPITKTFPKEMLPIVDKPIIHYLIEEAVASKIKDIVLVISKEKEIIKNYFKKNKKLEYFLTKRKKKNLKREIRKIDKFPKITYFYQKKPLGIADAILCAKNKIKNESFGLFFADDVVVSQIPCLKQLINFYSKYKSTVIGVFKVPKKEVSHYGVIKGKKISSFAYKVLDLVEKPKIEEAPSNLAIVGRYILKPEILPVLEKLKSKPIKSGQEIYLTDALKILLAKGINIYAYQFQGDWLSCGNKIGWLLANIKVGLEHSETREELKKYLKYRE